MSNLCVNSQKYVHNLLQCSVTNSQIFLLDPVKQNIDHTNIFSGTFSEIKTIVNSKFELFRI